MVTIGTLNGGNITIITGGSTPAYHEETWYKYIDDVEYKTVNISGTIALMTDMGQVTGQIEEPQNLVEIDIGSNVTSIGNDAFSSCYALKSVTIPTSVASIGNYVFTSCYSLETITVLGKTTSDAQTLLANANVPEGCTIIGELG